MFRPLPLMPFRGLCPFGQYIPSKPAKYGVKIWAASDATSSYAWNLQVYKGKPDGGRPEKKSRNESCPGLSGHNITCYNFFYIVQAGTGADHGGNGKEKQVCTPNSTGAYIEEACQAFR